MNKNNSNTWPMRAMDLNENDEWVEVPLENVLPKYLIDAINDEDVDMEGFVFPYLQEEFHKWLLETREIKEKTAEDYLRAYESGYEALYEEVGIDLYQELETIFEGTPEDEDSVWTKEDAPKLVKIYIDVMQEKMDKDEDSFTKFEFRALSAYSDFIIDKAGTNDKKSIKEKSFPLPEEEDFKLWLESEYKMDYENVGKIVSSLRRINLNIPTLVSDKQTIIDVVRALPNRIIQEKYIGFIKKQKQRILKNSECSYKTISNGLSNVNYYINFINQNIKNNK